VEHDEWRASLRRVHAHRAGLGLELARGHPPMASSDGLSGRPAACSSAPLAGLARGLTGGALVRSWQGRALVMASRACGMEGDGIGVGAPTDASKTKNSREREEMGEKRWMVACDLMGLCIDEELIHFLALWL
jgi:hypothetical protein